MLLLASRLLVELVGVAALAFWGANAPVADAQRVMLVAGAPITLVVVWSIVVAPKARNGLSLRTRGVVGTGLLLVVAAALASVGQPGWAVAFAAVVVVDEALILALDPAGALDARLGPTQA